MEDTTAYDGIRSNTTAYEGIPLDTKNTKRSRREAEEKRREEEEKRSRTEAEEEGEAACLPAVDAAEQQFRLSFGRNPSKNFLRTVGQSSLTTEQISMAIQQAADKHGIRSPEGYITQILRTWEQTGVPKQKQAQQQHTLSPDMPLEDWEIEAALDTLAADRVQAWLDSLRPCDKTAAEASIAQREQWRKGEKS